MVDADQSDFRRPRGQRADDIARTVGGPVVDHDDIEVARVALAQERLERGADSGFHIVGRHMDGDLHVAHRSMKVRTDAATSAGFSPRSRWNAGRARVMEAISPKSSRRLP